MNNILNTKNKINSDVKELYPVGLSVYVSYKKSPRISDKEKFEIYEGPFRSKKPPIWDIGYEYKINGIYKNMEYHPPIIFYTIEYSKADQMLSANEKKNIEFNKEKKYYHLDLKPVMF